MGVTGVEGVFRRCCEKTLSVMRENKEALLTIIEVCLLPKGFFFINSSGRLTLQFILIINLICQVFIHDPLYKWALSPLKALQRQKVTKSLLLTRKLI
jgi:ataxia telangiectasia mutated family protein